VERLSWHRTCERLGGDVILKIVAADALKRTPYLITRSCSGFFCHQIVSLPASTPANVLPVRFCLVHITLQELN
jgi:hypothetical protein